VLTARIGLASDFTIRRAARLNGDCNFVENPTLDSRDVQPQWLPSPSSVVRLIEVDEVDGGARFSLWRIPGRKFLLHDGRQLHLTSEIGSRQLRLLLSTGISDGRRFAFVMPAGADARIAWAATARLRALLLTRRPPRARRVFRRPTAVSLLHMRALQALDGALSGASQREIAVVLFGADVVAQAWHADGELRARIRYLIRRASALMNGGYCRLLHGRS
jgi:hypothetical protein